MISYDELLQRAQELSEVQKELNAEKIVESLSRENYANEIQNLSYDNKMLLFYLSYNEKVDDIFKKDNNFLNEFKKDVSQFALITKSVMSQKDMDVFLDKKELDKSFKEDPSNIDGALRVIMNVKYGMRNITNQRYQETLMNNKYVVEYFSDYDKSEKSWGIINMLDIENFVTKNKKLQDAYLNAAIKCINANDGYTRKIILEYGKNFDDNIKDKLLDRIKKEIDIEQLNKDVFNDILIPFQTQGEDVNKRLEALIDDKVSFFKEKGNDFLKNYIEAFENNNISNVMNEIYHDEKTKEKFQEIRSSDISEKFLNKNYNTDIKLEIIKDSPKIVDFFEMDTKTQLALINDYDNIKDKISFEKSYIDVSSQVLQVMKSNEELLEKVPTKVLFSAYNEGAFEDKKYLQERLLNGGRIAGEVNCPLDIFDGMGRGETVQMINNLSYNELINMKNKGMENVSFLAFTEKIVDNYIEDDNKIGFYDAPEIFRLANDEQKQKLLDTMNLEDKIKMFRNIGDDQKVKEIILDNIDEISNLDKHNYEDALKFLNHEELEKVLKSSNPEKVLNLSMFITDMPSQEIDYIEEYKRQIIVDNPENINYLSAYEISDVIQTVDEEKRKEILQSMTTGKLIGLSRERNMEDFQTDIKQLVLEKIKDDTEIGEYDLDGFLKISNEEEIVKLSKNLPPDINIKLYEYCKDKKIEITKEIIDNIKNNNVKLSDNIRYADISLDNVLASISETDRKELVEALPVDALVNLSASSKVEKKLIKDTILKKYESGVNNLTHIRDYSYNRFFNNLNPEEQEKITEINNNYFLSTGKITKDSPLYKAIQVADPDKVIDAKRILDSGYYEGENKEKLDFLIEKNQYILNSINIDLLSPNFSDYSKELIDKIARYRGIQKQLCSEKDKLKVFNKMIKNIDASGENINRTLSLIDTLRYETFTNKENAKLIESIGEDITPQQAQNLKDYLLRKETAIYGKRNKDSILASINTKEDILNFDEVLVSRCDDIFHNPNSTTDEKINALTSKYFGLSYNEVEQMTGAFSQGMSAINEKYLKENKEPPYESVTMDIFQTIVNIKENAKDIKSTKLLEDLYQKYEDSRFKITKESCDGIVTNCKNMIGRELSDSLYKENGNEEVRYEEFEGKKVEIVKMPDEFKLLVNSTAAYNEMEILNNNYRSSWNDSSRTSNHGICCSLISNEYLGTAEIKDVLIGFNEFGDDALQYSAPYDIYTSNDSFKTTANRRVKMLTSDEMINNTRHTHNEVDIERNETRDKNKIREEDRKYNNIQPAYVTIFKDMDEKLKQKAYKCAIDMDIKVLEIDRDHCAQKGEEKIDKLLEQAKQTGDISLFKTIIEKHENYRSGLRLERPDLVEKYFNKDKINNYMKDTVNGLVHKMENKEISMEEFSKKAQTLSKYIADEEAKFDITNETVARANSIDIETRDVKNTLDKNFNYYNNKVINIDKKLEANELLALSKEEAKDINQIVVDIKEANKDRQMSQEEINKLQKRALITKKLLDNSDFTNDEKKDIYKIQLFDTMSEEAIDEYFKNENLKGLTSEQKVVSATINTIRANTSLDVERINLKYLIGEAREEKVNRYKQFTDNIKLIEEGEISKTSLSQEDKEYISIYTKEIDKEIEKSEVERYDHTRTNREKPNYTI